MNNRMITSDFWSDGKVSKMPIFSRYLFFGLWHTSDSLGVFPLNTRRILADLFSECDMTSEDQLKNSLDEIKNLGFFTEFEYKSKRYGIFKNFSYYQKLKRESEQKWHVPKAFLIENEATKEYIERYEFILNYRLKNKKTPTKEEVIEAIQYKKKPIPSPKIEITEQESGILCIDDINVENELKKTTIDYKSCDHFFNDFLSKTIHSETPIDSITVGGLCFNDTVLKSMGYSSWDCQTLEQFNRTVTIHDFELFYLSHNTLKYLELNPDRTKTNSTNFCRQWRQKPKDSPLYNCLWTREQYEYSKELADYLVNEFQYVGKAIPKQQCYYLISKLRIEHKISPHDIYLSFKNYSCNVENNKMITKLSRFLSEEYINHLPPETERINTLNDNLNMNANSYLFYDFVKNMSNVYSCNCFRIADAILNVTTYEQIQNVFGVHVVCESNNIHCPDTFIDLIHKTKTTHLEVLI